MNKPKPPLVVGPYVHPSVWGGLAYHAPLRLLAVTKAGVLAWIYAGSTWGGALSGTETVRGRLAFVPFEVGTQDPVRSGIDTELHDGGRLSHDVLLNKRAEIEACLGANRFQYLHIRKCVLFDGAAVPPGAYLPKPKPAKKIAAATDLDVTALCAVCEQLRDCAAKAEFTWVPLKFSMGGADVSARVAANFGERGGRLIFRLETQTASTQYASTVAELRATLKEMLDKFLAGVPVVHGQPLVNIEARFTSSEATAVSWTEAHMHAVRKVASKVFAGYSVRLGPSFDPLLLTLQVAKSSHD